MLLLLELQMAGSVIAIYFHFFLFLEYRALRGICVDYRQNMNVTDLQSFMRHIINYDCMVTQMIQVHTNTRL